MLSKPIVLDETVKKFGEELVKAIKETGKVESTEKTDVQLDSTLSTQGYAADAKATGDAIAAASKKVHILYFDETNVTHEGEIVNYDYVSGLVSDRNSIVILYDRENLPFYYSSKSGTAVFFRRMAPDAIASVSVAKSGIYRSSQTYEQVSNKAFEITEANKNNQTDYPTIKAVVDYVQSVLK